MPPYNHHDLGPCFLKTIQHIQIVLEDEEELAFEKRYFARAGERVEVQCEEEWLAGGYALYLGVETELTDVECEDRLRSLHMVIASAEKVDDYFKSRRPGLQPALQHRVPPGLPAAGNLVYFYFNHKPEAWTQREAGIWKDVVNSPLAGHPAEPGARRPRPGRRLDVEGREWKAPQAPIRPLRHSSEMTDAFTDVVAPVIEGVIEFQEGLLRGKHPTLEEQKRELIDLLNRVRRQSRPDIGRAGPRFRAGETRPRVLDRRDPDHLDLDPRPGVDQPYPRIFLVPRECRRSPLLRESHRGREAR